MSAVSLGLRRKSYTYKTSGKNDVSEAPAPKVFISYSWTNEEHIEWVLSLARELGEGGVHIIIDKWDLDKGQDAALFMERMVNDPDIQKVILICDRTYKQKANERRGGAGAEAQIISAELYGNNLNSKFCAVLSERGEDGQAFVPTYYSSRIYIDLSEAIKRAENFDELLRWIFNKPLHVRLPIGKRPSFLDEDQVGPQLQTSTHARRAMEAIRNRRSTWQSALKDYLDVFATGFEKFRLSYDADFDDTVLSSITKFIPYRNEFLGICKACADQNFGAEFAGIIHNFFEKVIAFNYPPSERISWNRCEFDNFCFVTYELFLYVNAIFLKEEKFDLSSYLINTEFYVVKRSNSRNTMHPFTVLCSSSIETFERLSHKENKVSYKAYLAQMRVNGSGLQLRDLMQADLVLFLAAKIKEDSGCYWCPDTLVFSGDESAFPVFARSKSREYFQRLEVVIRSGSDDIMRIVSEVDQGGGLFKGRISFGVTLGDLINLKEFCVRP